MAPNHPPENKHDLIDRDAVLEILELQEEPHHMLQHYVDRGWCPRPRQRFDGVDGRGRKHFKPMWVRGEVLAAAQALAMRRVGQILDEAEHRPKQ